MKQKALYNSLTTILLQLVSAVIGLIIPRLIIRTFGSEINGITQVITQFLNYIVLLEAGVGGVVRAALYKPLVENDCKTLGGIIKATESFFRKIAYIFIVYLCILACGFPFMQHNSYSYFFNASLVIIIGLTTVAQYYFGITYMVFLQTDQRGYIVNVLSIFTVVLNAVFVYTLIKLGFGIHVVKLFSSIIFILKPLAMNWYVKKKYSNIQFNTKPDFSSIKQRWDGLAQHIAFFVYSNTDVVILTLFTDFATVSVYSVYYMIMNGLSNLLSCISAAFTPMIGRMIALNDKNALDKAVRSFELACFIFGNIVFTVAAFVIIPFVRIYVKNISDANYINYVFGFLMAMMAFMLIIRNMYNNIVLAAGHFKSTNVSAYIETAVNIVVSLALVNVIGLSGVALGTFLGLLYKTIYYIFYLKKHILFRPVNVFFKQFTVTIICVAINVLLYIEFGYLIVCSGYFQWAAVSLIITLIVAFVVFSVHGLFYKNEFIYIIKKYLKRA